MLRIFKPKCPVSDEARRWIDEQLDWRLLYRLGFAATDNTPAGHYREHDGHAFISVSESVGNRPLVTVATIAHEIGHIRLLRERRIAFDRPDGERLTDLVPLIFGLGVISANAVVEYGRTADGGWWSTRLGYLSEEAFGYALAKYALLRGERDPAWARYLDVNPRAYFKRAQAFLERTTVDRGRKE